MSQNNEENVDPLDDDMLLDEIVRALVTQPHDVKVTSEDSGNRRTLTISVAVPDRGRVIGREGKIIRMLETLMDTVGQTRGIRIEVKLEGSFHTRQHKGKNHNQNRNVNRNVNRQDDVEVSHVR